MFKNPFSGAPKPPKPADVEASEDFAMIVPLEPEPFGPEWNDEELRRCQDLLKRIGWEDGAHPGEQIENAILAYYRERGNRSAQVGNDRALEERMMRMSARFLQKSVNHILHGSFPVRYHVTPQNFGPMLEYVVARLKK